MGDLGSRYARMLRPFGCKIIGLRRTLREKPDFVDEQYTMESLEALLPRADVVMLCLPSNGGTHRFMNEARLTCLKESAVLLNIGRGDAVDLDGLDRSLRQGRPACAVLDVADPEPLPAQHPLWSNPNAIITPHVAGFYHTPGTIRYILELFEHNLTVFQKGGDYKNRIDPAAGYCTLR